MATASQRLNRNLDRMEQKGNDYHRRVREGFLRLAKERRDFIVVDASGDIKSTHEKVIKIIKKIP